MVLTIVDPHRGHEVHYNRWYERDHFYATCMAGPWLFSGSRWVATRTDKDLRFPEESPIARPNVRAGSYLAIYWIHAGHHDDYQSWCDEQARWLYENGRGFDQRTHVHTLLYSFGWVHYRDRDPIPLPLALDHGFAGLATVAVLRHPGIARDDLSSWLRDHSLPQLLYGSPIAMCSSWSPMPQNAAAVAIPRVADTDRLDLQLWFSEAPVGESWERFRSYARDLEAAGLGRVIYASPWRPTVVGTDRYTDELW